MEDEDAEFGDEGLLLEDLSPEAVPELEARLLRDRSDRRARLRLLGFSFRTQSLDPEQCRRHTEHCLWFIEHEPTGRVPAGFTMIHPQLDPSGYARGAQLWLAHLQRDKDNLAILRNAVAYFTLPERARARSLLEHAESIDPDNSEWPQRLGQLSELADHGPAHAHDRPAPQDALRAYQRALAKQQEEPGKWTLLGLAAKAALRSDEFAQAQTYAAELLESAQPNSRLRLDGDAVYTGHTVLGSIALHAGDLDEAVRQLLEAGRTPGSPVLGSFGPELDLADALLQQGRSQAVIEFLELCAKFWDRPPLRRWIERIRAGERPRLDRFEPAGE